MSLSGLLSDKAFEQWCLRLGISEQAKAIITQIRTLPPARHVQSSVGNVSGTYPSLKMGCAIQFESHRDELAFAYLMDHDPQVLEFYDQPYGQLKLKYRNQDDTRNVTATHTPDFFVLREDGAGWVECKMEEDLERLAKKMPFRYQRQPDGSWFCPPGEAYAAQFGLTCRSPRASRKTATRISRGDQAEQVTLTQRHSARYLTQPAISRDPKVRAILREVCREVELHPRETLG